MKIDLTPEQANWIERTADIETAQIFINFNRILGFYHEADKNSKVLLNKQIEEYMKLYEFLKTLRSKLELLNYKDEGNRR